MEFGWMILESIWKVKTDGQYDFDMIHVNQSTIKCKLNGIPIIFSPQKIKYITI